MNDEKKARKNKIDCELEDSKEFRKLRMRVAVLEELVIQVAGGCWEALGTGFAQEIADKINKARNHLMED